MILRVTVLITVLFTAASARAAIPEQPLIDQGKTRQQSVRDNTRQVADEISALIDEYQRNALAETQDLQMLKAVRGVLSQLSDRDMQKVVTLLEQAAAASNPDP